MKIINIFFITSILVNYFYAKSIQPVFELKAKSQVKDFVLDGTKLYVANSEGSIEIFNIIDREKKGEIFIPAQKNIMGTWHNVKILSVDRFLNKTLIVSTDNSGYRNVWVHNGTRLSKIVDIHKKMSIKEARFIDNDNIIFGTLAHDMIMYNSIDSYSSYSKQMEQSTLSDVVLNEDKSLMASASESGRVTLSDVKSGNILKIYESQNVDNIYKLDFKKGIIITAGQDRRVGVYSDIRKPYYIKSNFLVYCVALSPSANIGVYSSGEENNLQLFNIKNAKKNDILIGHTSVITTIHFIDENTLISAGDDSKILFWKLK